MHLILGSIPDQSLCVGETHIAGCGSVAHVICNDLDSVILPDTHTAILQQAEASRWKFPDGRWRTPHSCKIKSLNQIVVGVLTSLRMHSRVSSVLHRVLTDETLVAERLLRFSGDSSSKCDMDL